MHSGSALPFNDAVIVLKVKGQQLHLIAEFPHAVRGRGKRGVCAEPGVVLPAPFPRKPTTQTLFIPASGA